MLKHATPRSSPSNSNSHLQNVAKRSPNGSSGESPKSLNSFGSQSSESQSQSTLKAQPKDVSFNERSVDCEGIVLTRPVPKKTSSSGGLSFSHFLRNLDGSCGGIGPVITQGKAIVRRGLSFNGKKDPDSNSIRSVKSEGMAITNLDGKNTLPEKAVSEVALDTPTKNLSFATVVKNSKTEEHEFKEEKFKNKSNQLSKKILGFSESDHPSLKSLLRLPGVYGHIPVPDGIPTGSPHVLNPDSLSLTSADSFLSSNSGRTSSRSWSSNTSSYSNNTSDSCNSNTSSSSEPISTTLKVFAKCLRADIEYKTVNISSRVTCKELINLLLSKAKMKHRDPNLFYLTMEVTVRRWSGVPVRALLVLEDSAKPAQLALCRPSGDLRFVLQMRRGGVIKVHDTVLMPVSQYKSLLISYSTTSQETVQLLLNCYDKKESCIHFAVHEVCQSPYYKDRRLSDTERPLEVKAEWPKDRRSEYVFVLRRNMSQAISLRKLSMLMEEQKDRMYDHKKPGEVSYASETKAYPLLYHNSGRTRGRSLSPSPNVKPLLHDLEETVIDCTRTTPVMALRANQCYYPREFVINDNYTLNYYSDTNINNITTNYCDQTWPSVKTTNNNSNLNYLNRFNTTYPPSFVHKNEVKRPSQNSHKMVTFNLANTAAPYVEKSYFSLPHKPSSFGHPKDVTASSTNAPLTDYDVYQAKVTKALQRLNPHIEIDEVFGDSKIAEGKNKQDYSNCTSNSQRQSPLSVTKLGQDSQVQSNTKITPVSEPSKTISLSTADQDESGGLSDSSKLPDDGQLVNSISFDNERGSQTDAKPSNRSICQNLSYIKSKYTIQFSQYSGLSSTSVQTELTCIPINGLRNAKQKWNSVETLLDLEYSELPKVRSCNMEEIAVHDTKSQGDHNCRNCFYI